MDEPVIHGTKMESQFPAYNASLDEVIAFAKANRKLMMQSDIGRVVMKAIDAGNLKRLKKFWRGAK